MRRPILFLLFFFFAFNFFAQNNYTVNSTVSEIVVKGTSNVHDWHMVMTSLTGGFEGIVENNELKSIASGKVECLALNLKSDSKMMDGKALDALKGETFPTITFTFGSLVDLASKAGVFNCTISGTLSIAGKSNKVLFPCKGTIDSNGNLELDGTANITMKLFSIEPPTAMFGAIACGDPLSLEIKIQFLSVRK